MSREVAAACRGALSAGAEDVLVKDAHDSARNIDPTVLPRGARIHRAWSGDPLSMMTGLNQETFDAVFFTGYHAWAGCPGNPLSHTMNLKNDHVTLNGTPCSEFLLNAYTAGYYNVPVALITGDKALCDFARELIPAITTVAVNEGRGNGVTSIHPDEAVERIEAAAARLCRTPPSARCRCRNTSTSRWTSSSTTWLLEELLPRRVAEGRQVRLLRQQRLVRGAALLPLRAQRLSLYAHRNAPRPNLRRMRGVFLLNATA